MKVFFIAIISINEKTSHIRKNYAEITTLISPFSFYFGLKTNTIIIIFLKNFHNWKKYLFMRNKRKEVFLIYICGC
ncbi:hypothetical protein APF79_00420 [bacterium BRH_c32]|nr:MAG: hypothetical protein APF79_00420 [bacterium BRH_c32]